MKASCVHSCKGICNALKTAEHHEREAIKEYQQYVELCDYPDVREIMAELVAYREKGIRLLQEKREILMVKFNTIDRVNESFI